MRGADLGRLGVANSKDYEPTSKFLHARLRVRSPKKHLCTCLRNITFSCAIKSCQVNKTRVCTGVKLTSFELSHRVFQVVSYQSQLWKLLDASVTSWVSHLWKTEEEHFELCYLHCIAFSSTVFRQFLLQAWSSLHQSTTTTSVPGNPL